LGFVLGKGISFFLLHSFHLKHSARQTQTSAARGSLVAIMEEKKAIQVINCWDLNSIGIIAELRHECDGLHYGLIMKSLKSGNEWRIMKRILYNHIFDKQKVFPNEITTVSILNFASIDKQIISAKIILDKEADNIFQYHIQPIGHILKPFNDEMLIEMVSH
jgi:hypothetical protein